LRSNRKGYGDKTH